LKKVHFVFRLSADCRLIASLILLTCLGCGGGGPQATRVTGKVTYADKPVPKAVVTFLPSSPGAATSESAVTNESGEFSVQGGENRTGLKPGAYRIKVEAYAVPLNEIPPAELKAREESNRLIPKKFFSEETSGLTVTILDSEKTKVVPLDLKD
jgi:hypothetical protein